MEFLNRLMPIRTNENRDKIDKLFQIHQMEALKELKLHFDEITHLLDNSSVSQIDFYQRRRDQLLLQDIYQRYVNLA